MIYAIYPQYYNYRCHILLCVDEINSQVKKEANYKKSLRIVHMLQWGGASLTFTPAVNVSSFNYGLTSVEKCKESSWHYIGVKL